MITESGTSEGTLCLVSIWEKDKAGNLATILDECSGHSDDEKL